MLQGCKLRLISQYIHLCLNDSVQGEIKYLKAWTHCNKTFITTIQGKNPLNRWILVKIEKEGHILL